MSSIGDDERQRLAMGNGIERMQTGQRETQRQHAHQLRPESSVCSGLEGSRLPSDNVGVLDKEN